MNEQENKNDINYHYVNTSLELIKGVPAFTMVLWLPTIFFLNVPAITFSIVSSIVLIYLYRQGYTAIEFISIIKFILRNKKVKLYKEEDQYDQNN